MPFGKATASDILLLQILHIPLLQNLIRPCTSHICGHVPLTCFTETHSHEIGIPCVLVLHHALHWNHSHSSNGSLLLPPSCAPSSPTSFPSSSHSSSVPLAAPTCTSATACTTCSTSPWTPRGGRLPASYARHSWWLVSDGALPPLSRKRLHALHLNSGSDALHTYFISRDGWREGGRGGRKGMRRRGMEWVRENHIHVQTH